MTNLDICIIASLITAVLVLKVAQLFESGKIGDMIDNISDYIGSRIRRFKRRIGI